MLFHEMFQHVSGDESIRLEILSKHDPFIINSLLRCAAIEDGEVSRVDWPTIFSLVWGDEIAKNNQFPIELRETVAGIFLEMSKKEESIDPEEKKIHNIIIDLLQLLYEKQVNDTVEVLKAEAKRRT